MSRSRSPKESARTVRGSALNGVRSLWSEPAVKNPPPNSRRDELVAGVVIVTVLLEAALRSDLAMRPVAIAFGCGLAFAYVFRRPHPLAAVTYGFGTFAVLDSGAWIANATPLVLYSGSIVLTFAYALFRWASGRDAAIGLGVMAIGFTTSITTDFTGTADALGGAAVLLCTAALGVAVRYRDVARRQFVERVKTDEREQLARELHDTVAHHVSAIAIQAQAGLFLAKTASLSGATEALAVIDREAAQTLAEMRTMVTALRDRDNQPSLTPRRCLTDIERLRTNGTGANGTNPLRIDVAFDGDLGDLSPALEAALYRVAQESVTNAQRHAHHATRVEVNVTATATDVQMTVSDNGTRTATTPSQPGFGVVGMTERVTLLSGTLTAGPNPSSGSVQGWRVRAVLPRTASTT